MRLILHVAIVVGLLVVADKLKADAPPPQCKEMVKHIIVELLDQVHEQDGINRGI